MCLWTFGRNGRLVIDDDFWIPGGLRLPLLPLLLPLLQPPHLAVRRRPLDVVACGAVAVEVEGAARDHAEERVRVQALLPERGRGEKGCWALGLGPGTSVPEYSRLCSLREEGGRRDTGHMARVGLRI